MTSRSRQVCELPRLLSRLFVITLISVVGNIINTLTLSSIIFNYLQKLLTAKSLRTRFEQYKGAQGPGTPERKSVEEPEPDGHRAVTGQRSLPPRFTRKYIVPIETLSRVRCAPRFAKSESAQLPDIIRFNKWVVSPQSSG